MITGTFRSRSIQPSRNTPTGQSHLPRKGTIDGFSLGAASRSLSRITQGPPLSFPGTDAKPVDLDITQDALQNFDFPPVTADRVQIALETDGKQNKAATGIRKLRLKIRRPADFDAHVKPLASIGVLVAYVRGDGRDRAQRNECPGDRGGLRQPSEKTKHCRCCCAICTRLSSRARRFPCKEWNGCKREPPGRIRRIGPTTPCRESATSPAFPRHSTPSPRSIPSSPSQRKSAGWSSTMTTAVRANRAEKSIVPGVKPMGQSIPSWVIGGKATLSLGAGGVSTIGHHGTDIIACDLRLVAPQTWHAGPDHWAPNVLIADFPIQLGVDWQSQRRCPLDQARCRARLLRQQYPADIHRRADRSRHRRRMGAHQGRRAPAHTNSARAPSPSMAGRSASELTTRLPKTSSS